MIRGFIVILVALVLFSASGCTLDDVMGIKETEKTKGYEPKSDLTSHENHMLETWDHAASMADDVGDYTTAILYYTKIVDYFPETKEGIKAQERLKKLNKSSKKKDDAAAQTNKQ